MARTFFHDCVRDNGLPITVEYSYAPGSETTYSPMNGASGGDPCEVEIISSWPRNEEYDRLYGRRHDLEYSGMNGAPIGVLALQMNTELREELEELDKLIADADKTAELSDAEYERIGNWLCEHHVYEPDDPYDF